MPCKVILYYGFSWSRSQSTSFSGKNKYHKTASFGKRYFHSYNFSKGNCCSFG